MFVYRHPDLFRNAPMRTVMFDLRVATCRVRATELVSRKKTFENQVITLKNHHH